ELQKHIVEILREQDDETLKAELQDLGRRIRDARQGLGQFLKQEAEDHVYWVEKTGKTQTYHALNAAPTDVAGHLHALLFRDDHTCIMTSAKLSFRGAEGASDTGGQPLAYFRRRVGAMDVPAEQIGSPFDYQRKMKIHLARKMPDPRDANYERALAAEIERWVEHTQGRAFVLFTSYKTMQSLASDMCVRLGGIHLIY